jgi:uncharacterized protein YndB with AHSA1/START domain
VTYAAETKALPRPDLSTRPHNFTVERDMKATPEQLYLAWTERFDTWFAAPGVIRMRAEVDAPFYFETEYEDTRHPHYGRFLSLEPNRLVEITWVTGTPGTEGAETVVRVELEATKSGTRLRLTHAGFYDERGVKQHDDAWLEILGRLDDQLARGS